MTEPTTTNELAKAIANDIETHCHTLGFWADALGMIELIKARLTQQHAADIKARDKRIAELEADFKQLANNCDERLTAQRATLLQQEARITELIADRDGFRGELVAIASVVAKTGQDVTDDLPQSVEMLIADLTTQLAAAKEVIEAANKYWLYTRGYVSEGVEIPDDADDEAVDHEEAHRRNALFAALAEFEATQ